MRRVLCGGLVAILLTGTLGLGAAMAAPNNQWTVPLEVSCPQPVGSTTIVFVFHSRTRSFHIEGTNDNLVAKRLSGLLAVNGAEPEPFGFGSNGVQTGLEGDLITCVIDNFTVTGPVTGDTLTFTDVEAVVAATPRAQ